MNTNDLLQHYGTQTAIARAGGIKNRQTVNEWFRRGVIPEAWQFKFERLTRGKLKADWSVKAAA